MDGVKLNDAARDDLTGIWEYIAQNNPEAANRIIKEIAAKFATLRDHPHIGRERNYLLINLRSFIEAVNNVAQYLYPPGYSLSGLVPPTSKYPSLT